MSIGTGRGIRRGLRGEGDSDAGRGITQSGADGGGFLPERWAGEGAMKMGAGSERGRGFDPGILVRALGAVRKDAGFWENVACEGFVEGGDGV